MKTSDLLISEKKEDIPPCGGQLPISEEQLPIDFPRFQECIIKKGFSFQESSSDDGVVRIVIEY